MKQCWSYEPRLTFKEILEGVMTTAARHMASNPKFSPTSVAADMVGVQPVSDEAFKAAHTLMRFKERT